jgi:hypothetical protein
MNPPPKARPVVADAPREAVEVGGQAAVPVGVWRHVPSGHHYLVLGVATDSNNVDPRSEPQVIYVSLESDGRSGWPMHHRSLSEFDARFTPSQNASTSPRSASPSTPTPASED